ncbi:MAG TPA: hypothetical protein VF796_18010, partial [Humisphaera sp.]
GADEADNADAALRGLLDGPCAAAPLGEAAKVYPAAVDVCRRRHSMPLPDLAAKGVKLAADRGDADPRNGLAVLAAVRPLVLDTRAIDVRRVQLLRKWAAAEPANLDAVAPLASALVDDGKAAEAKALLLPLRGQLGDGEGARALGMALAREGDHDGAYALLRPYVQAGLDRLHAAEQAAEDASDRAFHRELDALEKKPPQGFMSRYKAADRDGQRAMVREHVAPLVRADPEVAAAAEALDRAEAVVPAALELGIATLQRAQAMPAGDARTQQLKAAEETFLAIRGSAGESDEYRLALGEVYYWLGRQEEGRKELDALLASKGRGPAVLVRVATKLRAVGAEADARALAEEAFGKAVDAEDKSEAAWLRAVLHVDDDDRIAWLRRTDQSSDLARASLAKALGDQAGRRGDDAEATRQYQAAVAALKALPRSSHQLNELSLAYYGLFRASGDRQWLARAVDHMQQAVDLDPANPVQLFNTGMATLNASLADVAGAAMDLRVLREEGGVKVCRFLYADESGREALAAKVRAHPGVAKAIGYLEKVTVLAPKNARAYTTLQPLYTLTRNEAALAGLAARAASAGIDGADELTSLRDQVDGKRDAANLASLRAALARSATVTAAARGVGGPTLACALCDQSEVLLGLDIMGQGDPAQAVALAEEAHRVAPSSATGSTVAGALLMRAARALRQADPAFDAYFAKHERTIGSAAAVVAALGGEPGPLRDAARGHPDVQAAAALFRAQNALYTDGYSAFEWALLNGLGDPGAEAAAAKLRASARRRVEHALSSSVRPTSPGVAVEGYWYLLASSQPDRARAELKRAEALGFPLPIKP